MDVCDRGDISTTPPTGQARQTKPRRVRDRSCTLAASSSPSPLASNRLKSSAGGVPYVAALSLDCGDGGTTWPSERARPKAAARASERAMHTTPRTHTQRVIFCVRRRPAGESLSATVREKTPSADEGAAAAARTWSFEAVPSSIFPGLRRPPLLARVARVIAFISSDST